MALSMATNYSSVHGIDVAVPAAYIRVDSLQCKKDFALAAVAYYESASSFDADRPAFKTELISFVPDVTDGSDNFIKQAYLHLKTLDDFSGAEDA
tara:strand:- start:46 stop:330 length:285 start_codon:yes stop_codon:yes gene_type:complete